MTKCLIHVLVCVIFAATVLAASGRQETAAGLPDKPEGQRKYDTKPFDREARSLPPGYPGHDIVQIYEHLTGAPAQGVGSKSFDPNQRTRPPYPEGLFALVCGQPTQDQTIKETRVAYNADRQIMSVTFLPLTAFSSSLMHRSIIVLREVKGPEKKLQTVDTSGSKTVVETYYEERYGVASDRVLHLSTDIDLKMIPEKARESKDQIGVLLVCRIKPMGDPPELTLLESTLSYATVTSPVETFYFQHLVGVELLDVWIYNKKTGAIYVKKQMSEQ